MVLLLGDFYTDSYVIIADLRVHKGLMKVKNPLMTSTPHPERLSLVQLSKDQGSDSQISPRHQHVWSRGESDGDLKQEGSPTFVTLERPQSRQAAVKNKPAKRCATL
ncbi:hypothetical protein RB195_006246 [Necator americanus]|uniref:Uncharacterized protein n=1 Tax=Necator americanus TaxID=51031 RepID=A0ABR1BTI6_NECAM